MVVNNRRPIYGVVDEHDPNIVRYQGSETSTANVTVDNVNNIIKVDVNASGILGETAQRAFAGHRGAELERETRRLAEEISKEIARALAVEESIMTNLNRFRVELVSEDNEINARLDEQVVDMQLLEQQLTEAVNKALENVTNISSDLNETVASLTRDLEVVISNFQETTQKIEEQFADIHSYVDNSVSEATQPLVSKIEQNSSNIELNHEQTQSSINTLNEQLFAIEKDVADSIRELNESDTLLNNKLLNHDDELTNIKVDALSIHEDISYVTEGLSKTQAELDSTIAELDKVERQLYNEIDVTEDNLQEYVLLVEDRINKTTTQTVANNKVELIELIEATDAKLTKNIRDVEQASISKDAELNTRITQTATELNTNLQKLRTDFDNTKLTQENKDIIHDSELTYIKSNYATKEFVDKKLVEFSKLSKQIADSVDVENDVVTIKGETVTPLDGVVYLVADVTTDGESTYKQYTVIDGDLVLIGDTKINLDDYATKDFVTEQIDSIPDVDLTDYAKKSDLPDVSTFISSIPEEYVTEDELTAKGYITEHQDLSDYASKVYVQAQIAKVGTLTKQIVESINIDNKTVVINGLTEKMKLDVIYLLLNETGDAYYQYTLVDGEVTSLGTTSVDLKNYATQEYVDEKFNSVSSELSTLLTSLKFIDGGTSSTLNI